MIQLAEKRERKKGFILLRKYVSKETRSKDNSIGIKKAAILICFAGIALLAILKPEIRGKT